MNSKLVVHVGDRTIPVIVATHPRARRMTLRADAARGEIRLTLPRRTRLGGALAMLDNNTGWIAARVARWPQPQPFVPGAVIPFDGGALHIDWSTTYPRAARLDGDRLRVGGPLEGLAGRVERFLRVQAKAALEPEARSLADRIGRPVTAVALRDPQARWGSCNSHGAIAFSWRLILAPAWVRTSVVAHEVAHLVHMDHSPAFWRLAAELYGGDLRKARNWLAREGAGLHWVGRHL